MKLTPTTNDALNGSDSAPHLAAVHGLLAGALGPLSKIEQIATEAAIEPEKKERKIAIVGTAPSSRGLAPFNDSSWEIWACSAGNMGSIPRVDIWFELHTSIAYPENASFGTNYIEWLKQQPFPLYMPDKSIVERAMPFPFEDMVREFGRYFFTSSFAWMMAKAICEKPAKIGLWGVDMASRDEYILQRSGGHFFLQKAVERGIEVVLPKESDLAQPPPLYGLDDGSNFLRKMQVRKKELLERIAPMEAQIKQFTDTVTYLKGAVEDCEYTMSIWGGVQSEVRAPVVPNAG